MKLIKINTDHYVVVDDSPKTKDFCIPIGTKYLDDTRAIREAVTEDIDYWASRKDYYIITHSTRPFGGSATAISLQEVKENFCWLDGTEWEVEFVDGKLKLK